MRWMCLSRRMRRQTGAGQARRAHSLLSLRAWRCPADRLGTGGPLPRSQAENRLHHRCVGPMSASLQFSLIIPTRNDAAALARTLDLLSGLEGIEGAESIVTAWGDPEGTERAVCGR